MWNGGLNVEWEPNVKWGLNVGGGLPPMAVGQSAYL